MLYNVRYAAGKQDAPQEAQEKQERKYSWKSKISSLMAENDIGIFAVSTFNTDYILTKAEDFPKALDLLTKAGYQVT